MISTLDEWIRKELTVNVEEELSKYKERIVPWVKLTPSGEVIIKRNDLTSKKKVLLYLIGKTYANIANYYDDAVPNKELEDAFGLPEGTVRNILFRLRKEGFVLSVKDGLHKAKVETLGMVFDKYFAEEKKAEAKKPKK